MPQTCEWISLFFAAQCGSPALRWIGWWNVITQCHRVAAHDGTTPCWRSSVWRTCWFADFISLWDCCLWTCHIFCYVTNCTDLLNSCVCADTNEHTGIILHGYSEIPLESIIHSINSLHAFERSHQFCVNNLNEFGHLSAWLDCNDSWPLPPASVHLIRPLLIIHELRRKRIAHIISHACATFCAKTGSDTLKSVLQ